jgi:thiamine biosynthesis lipoprotein
MRGWQFEIKDPRDKTTVIERVYLRDEALSTSGSYEDCFEVDGVRYSHILDPRTGNPSRGMLSVSVIATNAAESDALSTAFFVMGPAAAEDFCRDRPDLRVIMMELGDRDELKVTRIGI